MFQLSNRFFAAAMLMTMATCGLPACAAEPPQTETIARDVDFFAPGSNSKRNPAGKFSRGEAVKVIQKFSGGGTEYLRVVTSDGRDGFVVADAVEAGGNDQQRGVPNNAADTPLPIPPDASRLNDLAIKLMQSSMEPGQNLVMSPYGIWSNLRIVQHGARGDAAEELARLIGKPSSKDMQASIVRGMETSDALLHRPDVEFSDTFEGFIKSSGVHVTETNFDDASRQQLNDWIAGRSHGKIIDFFSPESWNTDAAVIVANVAWLKQDWAFPFNKKYTAIEGEDANFHLSAKDVIQVPMMRKTGSFETLTSDELQCDVVLLPFKNEELVAVLVVPHRIDGLSELLKLVDGESFGTMTSSVELSKTLVHMPRFEFNKEIDVLKALEKVGSNLSGLELTEVSSGIPVVVSQVIQKSRIKVDETGIEAVSATATGMVASSIDSNNEPIKEIRADRPFLFGVQHRPSQCLLFLAAVVNPGNASDPKQTINP